MVIGLAQFFQAKESIGCYPYPFPDLFQRACNLLALHMPEGSYPRTLGGLLSLCEAPVREWWPRELPTTFDSSAVLVYDGTLSEEANYYLYEDLLERHQVGDIITIGLRQVAIEDDEFGRLLERLRAADDQLHAQVEYVRLREFLIVHPYVTPERLRESFAGRHITPLDVSRLYDHDLPRSLYWNCDRCGPLIQKHGILRGIKKNACDDHLEGLPHVRSVPYTPGLCRIKFGIHWRISQPGVPELRLFEALETIQEQHPEHLLSIRRWPGLDTYDARLEFCDGSVWAADMKTHCDPRDLAGKLTPMRGQGELCCDLAFYVFPTDRLRVRDDYLAVAHEGNPDLPDNHRLLSDAALLKHVSEKITHLRRRTAR
jgi:hypothetical protein